MSNENLKFPSKKLIPPIQNKQIIGIDLGTTFSCAAIVRNNSVIIVPDYNIGERTIPSVICYYLNQCLIGRTAANKLLQCQETSITNFKRLIGHLFDDENVQNDIKFLPPNIYKDDKTKKPIYRFKVGNEEKSFSPEEASSMILKYIKDYVNKFEGKEVKKAVITVPAHFNNSQREATKKAAENAGLEVIRIINEPTAAAIAYGDENQSDEERKVLIFDLGGGTFDVSIVNIKGNEFTVLASCGEEHLGGEDFNELLVDYVIKNFKIDNKKFETVDFYDRKNVKAFKALQRVRKSTEKVKIMLSSSLTTNYDIDGLYDGIDLTTQVLRKQYEILCTPLWKKCFKSVDEALSIAKLKKENIDDIILVGGSTRIPKIKEMVKEYFNGKEPLITINPDEVVAHGATLVGLIESVNENIECNKIKINEITSLSIGIEVSNGQMKFFIPKGTKLPSKNKIISFTQIFKFPPNKEKGIIVKIYEGEDKCVFNNHFLGKFIIEPKYNDGKSTIEITMSIDHNSILNVSAKLNDGKEIKNIKISKSLFYDEIEAKVKDEKAQFINNARDRINKIFDT